MCSEARRRYTHALTRAEELEYELGCQLLLLALGDLALRTGDFAQAAALSRQLLARSEESTFTDVRAVALSNRARAEIALGNLKKAETSLKESRELAEKDGNYTGLIDSLCVQAELCLARQQGKESLVPVQELLALIEQHGETANLCEAQLLGARAHLVSGHPDEASGFAQQALGSARRSGVLRDLARAKWVLGICRNGRAPAKQRAKLFEEALAIAEEVGDSALVVCLKQEIDSL